MSFVKDIVDYPHYIYTKYVSFWNFLIQSYEGGLDYTSSSVNQSSTNMFDGLYNVFVNGKKQTVNLNGNLFQHKKERNEDYRARIEMSYYYNFCAPVVDIYTNHLFKQSIITEFKNIEKDIDNVVNDIDMRSSSIDEFRKNMAETAQIYGHCFVVVDSPNIDSNIIHSRFDQMKERAYPYLIIYQPQNIINWALDSFGSPYWVLLRENEEVNIDPTTYQKNAKYKCKYKLWTREYWALYDEEYNLIDEGQHGLGEVPIVCVYNKPSKKCLSYLGISSLSDIVFINRDIYNSCSELKQILRDQTFAILALQGNSTDYDELSVGTSKAILYPKETLAPQYVSPPPQNAEIYFKHIDTQISKIYQIAKLEGGSASFSGQNVVTQSGVSKAWDFNETNSSLTEKAINLEDAEYKIWNLFAKWLGNAEFDGSIQYPREFNVQSFIQDLDEAEKTAKLNLGATFDLEIKKSIHKKKFPSATEEQLQKMEQEAQQTNNADINRILNRTNSFSTFNRPQL